MNWQGVFLFNKRIKGSIMNKTYIKMFGKILKNRGF